VGAGSLVVSATMRGVRHPMRIARRWRPLLALMGGRPSGSWVDVSGDVVRFRFGPLFDETIPRRQIARTAETSWPVMWGVGWKVARHGTIGLIGAREGLVELRLVEPQRVRVAGIPLRCRRIIVSVCDPLSLLADLG
jgi:hypothetical protein